MLSAYQELEGRVAIVTGASRGLGRAFAIALAEAGAAVGLVARSGTDLSQVEAAIHAAGGRALALPGDVTDAAAASDAVTQVERAFGSVYVLVNAAGLGPPIGPLAECVIDDWWRTVEVNFKGPAVWCHAVLPGMLEAGAGRIINVASGAGTVAIPYLSAYISSKAALIRLTEVLASEVASSGVRVFAIEPGTVRTAMAEQVLTSDAGRRWTPWFAEIFARGQDITAERSAAFVVSLAGGMADALNGRFITVNHDLGALVAEASAIRACDGLVLRLTPPTR